MGVAGVGRGAQWHAFESGKGPKKLNGCSLDPDLSSNAVHLSVCAGVSTGDD